MRILFLAGIPYRKDTYGDFFVPASRAIPYGLFCLAAMVERKGFKDISFLDLELEAKNKKLIIEKIRKINPDVIGLTVYTIRCDKTFQLLREIKRALPKIVIVGGGPHVTIYPCDLIQQKVADYCMIGECDYSFPEFIDALQSGRKVNNIPNLVFQNGDGITVNPARELIGNLDELPFPALHLIRQNLKKYYPQPMVYKRRPVVYLITSRGCPYSCNFCSTPKLWGGFWRSNSPVYVVDLMQYLIEQFGIREFTFQESSFAVDRQRVLSICTLLIERRIRTCWTADVNLRNIDEELAYYMKKAGCWLLSCGIESGDDSILRSINKPLATGEVREKVNFLTKMGIKIRGYFMLGHMEESHKTLQATLDFSRELPLYCANFTIYVPEPGSRLFNKIQGEELKGPIYELLPFPVKPSSTRFIPKNMSQEEIVYMQKKAFFGFFLRWKQIVRLIKAIQSFEDIRRYFLMSLGAAIVISRALARKCTGNNKDNV